jgi:probable addiction module antidote protein
MAKKYKNSVSLEDGMIDYLQDRERAKGFLNVSLESYVEDGNINEFLHSLELVLKARQSIKSFSEEANMNRSNLYAIFSGKRKPQIHTVLKILAKLGYKFKVA